jgi:hypothetical protein
VVISENLECEADFSGAKARDFRVRVYAALKPRSSTVLHAIKALPPINARAESLSTVWRHSILKRNDE